MNEALLAFLRMASHRLGGIDARAEIGGRQPDDPQLVWYQASDELRIVVQFEQPPEHRDELSARLRSLSQAFLSRNGGPVGAVVGGHSEAASRHELDAVLSGLVEKSGGIAAMVTDENSPFVWGWSLPDDGADGPRRVDALPGLDVEEAPASSLARAAACLGESPQPEHVFWPTASTGVTWRTFAGVYRAALTFGPDTPALKAEATLVRALPRLEHVMLHWPTTDPEGGGARRLRTPLRLV